VHHVPLSASLHSCLGATQRCRSPPRPQLAGAWCKEGRRGERRERLASIFIFLSPSSLLSPLSSLPVLLPPLSRWSRALKVGQRLRAPLECANGCRRSASPCSLYRTAATNEGA
jgi:hypothetical protein